MNRYHHWGTIEGVECVSVNGRRMEPVPVAAGNLWQRFTLNILSHEYGERRYHPVNHLLLGRYLPGGRQVPINSLPPVFDLTYGSAMELTSADLTGTVEQVRAHLAAADESHLVDAIAGLDYALIDALLKFGVTPGQGSLRALIAAYRSYTASQSRPRREVLRVLLHAGTDPCSTVDGKPLLHHLCAGAAPAQDIQVLLEAGAWQTINNRDNNGDTPLLHYCRRGVEFPPAMAGLSLLLDAGADPNASNHGQTSYKLLQGGPEKYKCLAERLLEYGAEQFH